MSWVAMNKELATTFKKINRPYSEIEAHFSLALDLNCGKVRSISAYSRMWSWGKQRTASFMIRSGLHKTESEHYQNGNKTDVSLYTKGSSGTIKRLSNDDKTVIKREYKEQRIKKKKYGENKNVLLTEGQYKKLSDKFNGTVEKRINDLSWYMASKGASYKDHYRTILAWARNEDKKNKGFDPTIPY